MIRGDTHNHRGDELLSLKRLTVSEKGKRSGMPFATALVAAVTMLSTVIRAQDYAVTRLNVSQAANVPASGTLSTAGWWLSVSLAPDGGASVQTMLGVFVQGSTFCPASTASVLVNIDMATACAATSDCASAAHLWTSGDVEVALGEWDYIPIQLWTGNLSHELATSGSLLYRVTLVNRNTVCDLRLGKGVSKGVVLEFHYTITQNASTTQMTPTSSTTATATATAIPLGPPDSTTAPPSSRLAAPWGFDGKSRTLFIIGTGSYFALLVVGGVLLHCCVVSPAAAATRPQNERAERDERYESRCGDDILVMYFLLIYVPFALAVTIVVVAVFAPFVVLRLFALLLSALDMCEIPDCCGDLLECCVCDCLSVRSEGKKMTPVFALALAIWFTPLSRHAAGVIGACGSSHARRHLPDDTQMNDTSLAYAADMLPTIFTASPRGSATAQVPHGPVVSATCAMPMLPPAAPSHAVVALPRGTATWPADQNGSNPPLPPIYDGPSQPQPQLVHVGMPVVFSHMPFHQAPRNIVTAAASPPHVVGQWQPELVPAAQIVYVRPAAARY